MRGRGIRLVIGGLGAVACAVIVYASLDRRNYFFYRHQDSSTWEYPALGVAITVSLAAVETLLVGVVFGSSVAPALWQRGLGALVLLLPASFGFGMLVVHTPIFWMLHVVWLWLVTLVVGVATFASALTSLFIGLRSRLQE